MCDEFGGSCYCDLMVSDCQRAGHRSKFQLFGCLEEAAHHRTLSTPLCTPSWGRDRNARHGRRKDLGWDVSMRLYGKLSCFLGN